MGVPSLLRSPESPSLEPRWKPIGISRVCRASTTTPLEAWDSTDIG